jgi:hypothetical protein
MSRAGSQKSLQFPFGVFFYEPCLSLGIGFPGPFLTIFLLKLGRRQSSHLQCTFPLHFLAHRKTILSVVVPITVCNP